MIIFSCHTCGQRVQMPDKHGGKKGKCPKCGGLVTIPKSKLSGPGDIDNNLIDFELQSGPVKKDPATYEVSSGDTEQNSSAIQDYILKKNR